MNQNRTKMMFFSAFYDFTIIIQFNILLNINLFPKFVDIFRNHAKAKFT